MTSPIDKIEEAVAIGAAMTAHTQGVPICPENALFVEALEGIKSLRENVPIGLVQSMSSIGEMYFSDIEKTKIEPVIKAAKALNDFVGDGGK